jgi:uncharacterized protein (TIGR02118 family)
MKLVYCVRKRADMSDEEFRKYWLEKHGPLVRGFAEAIGAKKYVQSHTIAPEINAALVQSRGLAPPYDGITEVWWDDMDSFVTPPSADEARAAARALIEDEARFIDFSQSRVFMTEEHVIFDLSRER